MRDIAVDYLLNNVTATGAGAAKQPYGAKRTFQAFGKTSAGAGSAVAVIEVSNDGSNWIVAGTISLTLSDTNTTDGFHSDAAWKYVRANLTTLTGTNAACTVLVGNEV